MNKLQKINDVISILTEFSKSKHFENGYVERLPDGEIEIRAYFSDDDTERISKETTYKANTRFYISFGIFVLFMSLVTLLPISMSFPNLTYILVTALMSSLGLILFVIGIYRKIKQRLCKQQN